MRNFLTLFIALTLSSYCLSAKSDQEQPEVKPITAKLSGTARVTSDLDASIQFYSEFLSFSVKKRIVLDSEASTMVFGVSGQKLNYVSMIPAGWTKENRNGPDLNFVEIPTAGSGPYVHDVKRASFLGETVIAYNVKNLAEVERRMRKAKVPFVVPMAPSASGRSLALTVLDPNGVRVQMYEFGL